MKVIMALRQRGFLTDQQVLHAHKFSRAPNSYSLAPSFYRVLYDVVIKEEPLEELEKRRGWAARSAKVVISLILFSMQEVNGSQIASNSDEDEEEVSLQEQVEYLRADNAADIMPVMKAFKMTMREARLFLLLKRSPKMQASRENLLNRLYAEEADEAPQIKIIDIFICKMRRKLKGSNWRIETVWGSGYKLVGSGDLEATDQEIYWYKLHVYKSMTVLEIASNSGVAPSAVMQAVHRLMSQFSAEELDNLVAKIPADYTVQK